MMQVILSRSWKEDFAAAVRANRDDLRWKDKLAVNEAREKQRASEEKAEEARKDAATAELIAFALATPHEVAAFRVTLDKYDTATVELLMDNDQALQLVRKKIDTMLEQAHVLPDGRRVFKTKDGESVFDEFGKQLSSDLIDPHSIDDNKIEWEAYKAEKDTERRLEEERQKLFDYQAKLDDARARLDKGTITKQELEEIKTDLLSTAPEALREKLGLEKPDTKVAEPKQETEAKQSSLPGNMDKLVQQAAFTPASPM